MTLGTVKPSNPAIAFTVIGDQVPHGLRPVPRYGAGREIIGQAIVKGRTPEQGRAIDAWSSRIANEAARAYQGALLDGPLAVEFRFIRPRPQGHYGSGKNAGQLKPAAPRYPTTRPDLSKLVRVAEDALTDVVWRDDSQIVEERLLKVYGEPARLEIDIFVLDAMAQPLEAPAGQLGLDAEEAA